MTMYNPACYKMIEKNSIESQKNRPLLIRKKEIVADKSSDGGDQNGECNEPSKKR